MLFFQRCLLLLLFVILLISLVACAGSTGSTDVSEKKYQRKYQTNTAQVRKRPYRTRRATVPKQNETVTLPVSVYLLKFSGMQELNASYTRDDVMGLFEEVNAIWSKYGFIWNVTIVETVNIDKNQFQAPGNGFSANREFRNAVAAVIPDASQQRHWRVYLVKQFPVQGSSVFIPEKSAVLYGESNSRGKQLPVILAHELGHSLGLRHVSSPDNLMYAGPQRNPEMTVNLDSTQIQSVREQAEIGPFYRRARR